MRFPLLFTLRRALLLAGKLLRLGVLVAGHSLRRGALPEAALLGRQLRRLAAEMGVTYVKFGQFLAMRFDILPLAVCRELGQLMENVPPMDFTTVRHTVEEALGGPLERTFARFEPVCVASASIAQVHEAWTHDGERLAVKVRRPRIAAILRADTRGLRWMAWLADRFRLVPITSLAGAVDEFVAFTLREMDFLTEGRTAERLGGEAGPCESAPRVYWEWTTESVLTMEFIEGVSLATLCDVMDAGGPERVAELLPDVALDTVLRNFIRAALRQLFESGFFHADLHPGNLLVRGDGTVVFVDFGIFSELDTERRRHCAGYIGNIARRRFAEAFRHYLHLVVLTPDSDLEGFRRDSIDLVERWYRTARDPTAPVQKRHMGTFWTDSFALFNRHGVRIDIEMTLFWRALFLLDSTTLRLSKDYDLLRTVEEFFAEGRFRQIGEQADAFATPPLAAVELVRDLPGQLDRIRRRLAAGGVVEARIERSRDRRRGGRPSTRQVLALAGVSAAILAGRAELVPAAAIFFGLAGLLLLAGVLLAGGRVGARRR